MTRWIISLLTFIVIIFGFNQIVYASPSQLIAVPYSETEGEITTYRIELNWLKGSTDTSYDVWMSRNGHLWEKLNSTSVTENTYIINQDKFELYVNYYFVVSNEGTVTSDPIVEGDSDGTSPNTTDVAVAFPPGQTIHGNYKNSTNACAKCHRTHAADGSALLIQNTINDTCQTCHDGTQSKYDVLRGEIKSSNNTYLQSPAGPFGNIFGYTSHDKDGDSIDDSIPSVMSIHSISDSVYLRDALKTPLYSDAWNETLGCGSCHYVHGSEYVNKNDSSKTIYASNYRMLATTLPGKDDIRVLAFAETDKTKGTENIYYKQGMNKFCAGCHTDYYEEAQTISGETYEIAKMKNRQHNMGVAPFDYTGSYGTGPLTTTLPLEGTVTDEVYMDQNKIMCLTCHSSHGSNSVKTVGNGYEPNYLLRKDNDGVCVDCHQ